MGNGRVNDEVKWMWKSLPREMLTLEFRTKDLPETKESNTMTLGNGNTCDPTKLHQKASCCFSRKLLQCYCCLSTVSLHSADANISDKIADMKKNTGRSNCT